MSSQLPADPVFECGERYRAIGEQALESRGELGEGDVPEVLGVEEGTQVESESGGQLEELIEGERVDDLLVEALEVLVCRVRDAQQRSEFRNLAAARRADLGQALRLAGRDQVSGFDKAATSVVSPQVRGWHGPACAPQRQRPSAPV
jgi:hypothetical protein